jgi:hypothetical protein
MTDTPKSPTREAVLERVTNAAPTVLPDQIARQVAEADHMIKELERAAEMHPRPGPVAEHVYTKPPMFAADSEADLAAMINETAIVVGERTRGNKRLGRIGLFADLVQHFRLLRELGITLPRGGSLSRNACSHGLLEILREHCCLEPDQTNSRILKNGAERAKLGHKLERVFGDIAAAI